MLPWTVCKQPRVVRKVHRHCFLGSAMLMLFAKQRCSRFLLMQSCVHASGAGTSKGSAKGSATVGGVTGVDPVGAGGANESGCVRVERSCSLCTINTDDHEGTATHKRLHNKYKPPHEPRALLPRVPTHVPLRAARSCFSKRTGATMPRTRRGALRFLCAADTRAGARACGPLVARALPAAGVRGLLDDGHGILTRMANHPALFPSIR
jgi:hypothetical protein